MRTSAFIDASNLFYGGKESLGWSIDYKKLYEYLERKYSVSKMYYFGGVEIHRFPTAKEIKRFAGSQFLDFEYLRTHLEFEEKKKI